MKMMMMTKERNGWVGMENEGAYDASDGDEGGRVKVKEGYILRGLTCEMKGANWSGGVEMHEI